MPFIRPIATSLVSAAALLVTSPASADSKEQNITYDFGNKQMIVHGYFAPANAQIKRSGLDAEMDARRDGVSALTDHLGKSCGLKEGESNTAGKDLRSGWNSALRSQGSEIYSNKALRIILTANLREVFSLYNNAKTKALQTPEGESVFFRLPKMPAQAVRCGLVTLALGAKKSVLAAPVSAGKKASGKVVALTLSDAGVLQPATPEDLSLIQKTELGKLEAEGATAPEKAVEIPAVGG